MLSCALGTAPMRSPLRAGRLMSQSGSPWAVKRALLAVAAAHCALAFLWVAGHRPGTSPAAGLVSFVLMDSEKARALQRGGLSVLVWPAGAGVCLFSTQGFDHLASWCGQSTLPSVAELSRPTTPGWSWLLALGCLEYMASQLLACCLPAGMPVSRPAIRLYRSGKADACF